MISNGFIDLVDTPDDETDGRNEGEESKRNTTDSSRKVLAWCAYSHFNLKPSTKNNNNNNNNSNMNNDKSVMFQTMTVIADVQEQSWELNTAVEKKSKVLQLRRAW